MRYSQGSTGGVIDLEKAASAGDGAAQLELARLYLTGRSVERDLSRSRRFFQQAASNGVRAAVETYRAFVASGTGGASDWQEALRLLHSDNGNADAEEQLWLISEMKLDAQGRGSSSFAKKTLFAEPRIVQFPSFLSVREADYLIDSASNRFRPSIVLHPSTGAELADPIRSSFTAGFPLALEQPAIHAINLRIAAASGSPVGAGEPLTILRYTPGQQYRPHLDTLPNAANQRSMTMLLYLNDNYAGGETYFPRLKLTVKGRKGDAMLISNLDRDGRADQRLLHEGRPVVSGSKFIASRWVRQSALTY
jgi:prolyl 4-hydroxylase